jgi:putative endopeptidase
MRRIILIVVATVSASITVAGQSQKVIDPANMDFAAKPCTDFYQYANGAWLKANPVPSDQSRWGSFNQLTNHNREILKAACPLSDSGPPCSPENIPNMPPGPPG